jgi:hypothetical protein
MIYRWYKILSPRILLDVKCSGMCTNSPLSYFAMLMQRPLEYNQASHILFVEIRQLFSIFFVPFYKSDVHLTTKLVLSQNSNNGKFYIESQEDLYQSNEVVKFFWPGGATIIWLFQMFATLMCILGALVFAPITWWEQKQAVQINGVKGN